MTNDVSISCIEKGSVKKAVNVPQNLTNTVAFRFTYCETKTPRFPILVYTSILADAKMRENSVGRKSVWCRWRGGEGWSTCRHVLELILRSCKNLGTNFFEIRKFGNQICSTGYCSKHLLNMPFTL